jgi:hypothetical protein
MMFNRIFVTILVIVLLSACDLNTGDSEQARQALSSYFGELSNGNYFAASQLYGGSYETLVSFNPDLDEDDHIQLWKNGCEYNGLQCLPTRTITFNELAESGEYVFTVEFNTADGNLFVLEACCGENPTNPPVFQFEYRVVKGGDGKFLVLDMPVYMP